MILYSHVSGEPFETQMVLVSLFLLSIIFSFFLCIPALLFSVISPLFFSMFYPFFGVKLLTNIMAHSLPIVSRLATEAEYVS
jgi:hypothetical protein